MTTIKVTPGDNNDSIETYIASIEYFDETENEDKFWIVTVTGPSAYNNALLFDEKNLEELLHGGYQRLESKKLVGLPVCAEYTRGELNYIEFRDIADDEFEGPCAEVRRFQTNGAL